MSEQSYINQKVPEQLSIQPVGFLRPFIWLAYAWQDLLRHPIASLAYGFAVSALLLVIFFVTSLNIYVIVASISGFMLIGPIMAAGLCELSRRNENDEAVGFDESIDGLQHCQSSLTRFAGILLGFSALWFLLSGLVLSLTVGDIAPPLDQTMWGNFLTLVTPSQLLLYAIVGGILACVAFVVSVVSVPAIIDNSLPSADAMAVSFKATLDNLPTMLLWAFLIVLLSAVGFVTFLIGMIIIYPLLGHATWHAYRDIVNNQA